MGGERIGKPRRGAEHARDESDEIGVLPQQREQPRAAVQIAEKAVEGDERGIGVLGARDVVDEERHELGEDRARRRPPQRPRRAGEPSPHRLRHLDRLAEPHRAQLVEGFGSIGLGRKDEAAALGGARRRVLEQARIVALHRAEVAEQRRREGVPIGVAHEAGERRELLRGRGQRMGLLVGDHLQAMLDGAQEHVRAFEIVAGVGVDPAPAREPFERCKRLAAAQRRVTAAGDQLLGLHEELDLADAAAAELDVVAFDRDFAAAAIGLNLPLHLVDVAEGDEIEIFAPDEGRKLREQSLAGGNIAGAGTRLDHGGAFPVLSAALVIVEGRRGRHRDLRRRGIGTQPQVDAEDIALRRALLQELHELAGQAHEQHRRLDAVHQRRRIGIEQHDEVDVARIVELARAHLAHGEHAHIRSRPQDARDRPARDDRSFRPRPEDGGRQA